MGRNTLLFGIVLFLIVLVIGGLFLASRGRPPDEGMPKKELAQSVEAFGTMKSLFEEFDALLNEIDQAYDIPF